ncbi:recombinase family protein [uncultured Clostridium sp.]|jgi:DNA invertase Pin-like site-specific DNA recombinase|uniref:recombinase family protein n=1 Tax=uncultured Clostridium sp. TaxID=59620 RepID=UPI0026022CFC|nr:recombinase family protein [uncultured Clostridium sp.]
MESKKNKNKNKNKEYAAIYARISGEKKNNSISSQIEEGTLLAYEKNLLIYSSYVDKVSGKSLSPEERKGYKKLLIDAKAGCFKTLIIYRYDRLVRNYDDWIKTSSILKKLGIKILLADKTQPPCNENPNDNFLTNLMVLFSDFEPDTIKQRVNEGKKIVRTEGVYNSGASAPFGYERKKNVGEKTTFRGVPICKEFVVYIYKSFYDGILNKRNDYKNLTKEIYEQSKLLINELEESVEKQGVLAEFDNENFDMFVKSIKKYEESQILEGIKKVQKKFFINKIKKDGTSQKAHYSSMENVLKNNIYSGFLLVKSAKEENPLGGFSENSSGEIEFDINKFVKTKNVEPLITEEIFIASYSVLRKEKIEENISVNPFLFKEILKCSKCKKKFILQNDGIITCFDKCFSIFYDELIKCILRFLISNIFEGSPKVFKEFEYRMEKKLLYLNNGLNKAITYKGEVIKDFISGNKIEIVNMKEFICNKNKDISYKKQILNGYEEKLSDLKEFEKILKTEKDKAKKDEGIEILVTYILNNEEYFHELLKKIVSEISIGVDYESKTIQTSVTYEFKADKNSNIYKSIY